MINPRPRSRARYSDEQRERIAAVLDRHIETRGENDCWLWIGSRLPKGYGSLKYGLNGRTHTIYAHRAAFERANGYLPRVVRHSCDNPPCCNPKHLLGGNQKDNMADMIQRGRGRHARGSAHTGAKLTEDQINEIRLGEGFHREIADRFGVDKSTITRIKSGESWAHVPGDLPPKNPHPNRREYNPRVKLTPQQVEEIRFATGRQADIALRYGVSQTTVSRIRRGDGWKP